MPCGEARHGEDLDGLVRQERPECHGCRAGIGECQRRYVHRVPRGVAQRRV